MCERDRERRGARQRGDRAHMVPLRPGDQIVRPQRSTFRAVGRHSRQRVITWHVEQHRHQECAEEIKQAAGNDIRGAGFVPAQNRCDAQEHAQHDHPQKRCEKPGIDDDDINRLHGGDAVCRRDRAERLHYQDREGKEEPRHETATKSRHEHRKIHQAARLHD